MECHPSTLPGHDGAAQLSSAGATLLGIFRLQCTQLVGFSVLMIALAIMTFSTFFPAPANASYAHGNMSCPLFLTRSTLDRLGGMANVFCYQPNTFE